MSEHNARCICERCAYAAGVADMRAACIAAVKAITPYTSGIMRELVQNRDKTLEALRTVKP